MEKSAWTTSSNTWRQGEIVENKCFAERQNRNQSTVRSNFSNYYDNKLTGDSDELHVIK